MCLVMLGKQQLGHRRRSGHLAQFLPQYGLEKQLLLQPYRHRRDERCEATRRLGEITLEQSLELDPRLVIEDHGVELIKRETAPLQAVANRAPGERRVVAQPAESFLLGRSANVAVDHQRRGAVMVISRQSQDRGHQYGLLLIATTHTMWPRIICHRLKHLATIVTESGSSANAKRNKDRRKLFLAIALLLPLLTLLLLEGLLRIAGFAPPEPLFVPVENAPGQYIQPNEKVIQRYFADPRLAP